MTQELPAEQCPWQGQQAGKALSLSYLEHPTASQIHTKEPTPGSPHVFSALMRGPWPSHALSVPPSLFCKCKALGGQSPTTAGAAERGPLLLIYSAPAGPRPAGPPGKPQVLCPAEPGSTLLANREAIPAKAHCLKTLPTRWSGQRNMTTQTAAVQRQSKVRKQYGHFSKPKHRWSRWYEAGVRLSLLSLQAQLCRRLT